MALHLSPLQLGTLAVGAILLFSIFMAYIVPKFFGKGAGGKIRAGAHRPNPIILDKSIAGGQAMIEAREIFDNGRVVLHLRNHNGAFVKEYSEDELSAVSISQVMADREPAIFTTKDIKYAQTGYDKDLKETVKLKEDAFRDRDYWKSEYEVLKANIASQVDKEVQRAISAQKMNRPDWSNKPT